MQTTCVAVLAGLGLALSATSAGAASPLVTAQAAAANAAFLAYAPPPPGGARALCLVDTGVNAIADTAPGLVSATALDGGTGNDVDPLLHGTIDAAIAGGAGHGVLGAWPQLKIVSVRATDVPSPGQVPTFQYDDYVLGTKQCSKPVAGVADSDQGRAAAAVNHPQRPPRRDGGISRRGPRCDRRRRRRRDPTADGCGARRTRIAARSCGPERATCHVASRGPADHVEAHPQGRAAARHDHVRPSQGAEARHQK
ncbi:MAG: hypothetical protein LC790_11850 [Actinobacteria bacterium]|nr:hypothetical protein [Actinomycetota bacterium]